MSKPKSEKLFEKNLKPVQPELARVKKQYIWYSFVSVVFLLATVSNFMDYNNRKVIFFIDVAVFLLAINEAKHSRTRLKSIEQATKNKEVKKDKDNE